MTQATLRLLTPPTYPRTSILRPPPPSRNTERDSDQRRVCAGVKVLEANMCTDRRRAQCLARPCKQNVPLPPTTCERPSGTPTTRRFRGA
ncbi:hypothetical protein E2C01_018983 [Portunus trituberculatus]|uniref:Uncharacterized protein n=1 Tax=Portunus trituberculatus TaxID=210409 RepID=A0A5B7DWH1_PORTR|nr:hypothetical protein [Portunus trituberculatus]